MSRQRDLVLKTFGKSFFSCVEKHANKMKQKNSFQGIKQPCLKDFNVRFVNALLTWNCLLSSVESWEEGKITVSWGLNQSFPTGTDEACKKVEVRLCYAPVAKDGRRSLQGQDLPVRRPRPGLHHD